MAVVVAACTLVAFLMVTLEGDSFYQTQGVQGGAFLSLQVY
jgi:hypothetical protein